MYCSNRKNSKLDHHFLVLSTHFEEDFSVDRQHFTGAILTSTRSFGHGRYEVRAVQPVGWQIQTRLLTKNSKEMLPKNGQLNFASNNQDGSIYRDVQVVNASSGGSGSGDGDDNQDENSEPILIDDELVVGELSQADEYLHRFHLYGMEWDSNGVRFFFDDHYSEVIVFSEFMKSRLQPADHQIVLQTSIGGLLFEEKMLLHEASSSSLVDKTAKSGDELDWKCPAFIIDYVRFYEKVENPKNESQQMIKCSDRKMLVQKSYKWSVVEEICQSARRTTFFGKVYRLRKTLICLAVNIAIIILIAFLLYKIWSLRRRLSSDQKLLNIFGDQNVEGAEESDNTYEALGNDYEDFGEVETERPESNDNNHQVYGYQQSKEENNLNDKNKPVQEKTLEDIYAQVMKNKKVKKC
ncbi:hypothetical protein TYRP_015293 [Tyrophagus putrescentiae]|nr:hypothetical protein TYRP_015293 [Tyrophagus putrescentiae]